MPLFGPSAQTMRRYEEELAEWRSLCDEMAAAERAAMSAFEPGPCELCQYWVQQAIGLCLEVPCRLCYHTACMGCTCACVNVCARVWGRACARARASVCGGWCARESRVNVCARVDVCAHASHVVAPRIPSCYVEVYRAPSTCQLTCAFF